MNVYVCQCMETGDLSVKLNLDESIEQCQDFAGWLGITAPISWTAEDQLWSWTGTVNKVNSRAKLRLSITRFELETEA